MTYKIEFIIKVKVHTASWFQINSSGAKWNVTSLLNHFHCEGIRIFHHRRHDTQPFFFPSSRPASTSSSTLSSLAGSFHWPPEARMRRSSESASTSSSCPSASSSRRTTKAPVRSHKHRCVLCICKHENVFVHIRECVESAPATLFVSTFGGSC